MQMAGAYNQIERRFAEITISFPGIDPDMSSGISGKVRRVAGPGNPLLR